MTTLNGWIMGLTGAAILTAAANALTPKGKVKNVMRLLCGVVMALCLISPLAELDFTALSGYLAQYSATADGLSSSVLDTNDRLTGLIIEGRCSAYILDKAQSIGLDATEAAVTVKRGDEGAWYPYEVTLDVRGSEASRSRLEEHIISELGIPKDRQYWRNGNDVG